MGLFFYTQKGSIISMVDLPTTEIIEPFFLFQKYLDMKVFCDRIDNGNRNEHGYDTLQKDKAFLDAEASSSAFLFCCVSLTPLYLNEIEHGL